MFRQTLLDRLDWTSNASLENRQRKLAYKHLARGDYLRAAIHGFESVITTQCEQRGLTAGDYGAGRKPARDAFEDELKRHDRGTDRAEAYWRLKAIRDTMAHGSPPTDKRDRKVLKDEDRLSRALAWYFKVLLGPDK